MTPTLTDQQRATFAEQAQYYAPKNFNVWYEFGSTVRKSKEVAAYWEKISNRIQRFETNNSQGPVPMDGSGFHGAFIATTLTDLDRARCFLDRSPFQQGKKLFGKDTTGPENILADTQVVYVRLTPAIARKSIDHLSFPRLPHIKLVYIDGGVGCD